MKKRIASLFLAVIMLISLATSVFPIHVHATGLYCEGCGEWKDDSVNWCSNCYLCEDCVDGWCPDCANCYLCGYELGLHCPDCFESCVDPSYGNVPHCVNCMKCENCADLTDTSMGTLCEDCLEDFRENGANKMCANCDANVIYNEDLDEETEACADCGEHCVDCYEEFLCPECSECTLCKGVELCESCGICEECTESCGYHCPECGDCYADVGQCPDEGEHCVNCCEFVCDNCGTCADGAGIDYCEECEKCENCWEHCEVCEECFEENGECEEHGDHCAECCVREGWICDGCGRCTEALGLEFCEYCDLCEECCRENSKYYGVKKCILDKETKPETLDPSKHDENHHILRYNSSSEECHDVWCIFPGCDYYLSDCTPHEFQWKTVKKPLPGVNGLQKGICVYCGVETTRSINSKISEVQFENFTWLVNGQTYTQSKPTAKLKSDFPGTITKQQIKINGQVMEADTFAGENIELAVYIKLNDGYTWNSSVNAWLDGKVADDFLKISSMGENERVFIWKHTTEYTDKIKITEQSPETLEYTNGEDVKLYVKATGASNYQWSMYEERGVGIKTVRGFYKIDGATSNEYIIKNADSSLDGKEYRCTLAVDDATIFTKTITLKLVEKKTEQPTTTEEKTWTKASEWAETELDKANKLDVIPELFKGQDLTQNITRKEFTHVAVKLYEKLTGNKATAVANNPFKDTDDVEVLKAYKVGIVYGTGADTFTPDALITREQMATMMTRALTKAGIDTKVDLEKVTKFADDAEMHDWGKESIYYMSSIEIIKGIGNNTFNVLGNATREQALLISVRSAEKFAK